MTPPSDQTSVPQAVLNVFLAETRIGHLASDAQGRMTFTYKDADAPAISLSMPARTEPYADDACRPFFAGLLPEGAALERAAAQKRLQVYETYKLLQAYGAECAGAVRLLLPDALPSIPSDYELLEGARLEQAIADVGVAPIFAHDRRARLSVAGVQYKTAVRMKDGQIFEPLDGSPSTHLVKVANSEYRDLLENEAFCMQLAAKLGLKVANVGLRQAGAEKFLLVERYDRADGGNRVTELHQEDLCQALGYPPARKYELEDGNKVGPGLQECFALLRKTRRPAVDLSRFIQAILFNYLIGNADAHAKNYSLLYDDVRRAPELAPLYDLVCTRLYRSLTTDLAMRIGAAADPEAVTKDDWKALAQQAGIRLRRVREIASDLATRILPAAKALRDEAFGYLPAENIIRVIGGRMICLGDTLEFPVTADVPPFVDRPPGWSSMS